MYRPCLGMWVSTMWATASLRSRPRARSDSWTPAAWPSAEIAVMGADGAVNIVFRSELKKVAEAGGDVDARRAELVQEYKDRFANPYQAAERGYVDDVIQPEETRPWLVKALEISLTKRVDGPKRKHGNIPL